MPQGKPNNTGVGTSSFLQQIFPTQESNWDLLHCRQILYQLSYQGSPKDLENTNSMINSWIKLQLEDTCDNKDTTDYK